jgi:peptidoglycan/LPS O-acetylase OafA/YrhL
MKKDYFPALTGIRAIAAYMVYIHHFNPFKAPIFGQSVHDFFNEFHVGVTIFFVLSGFLITYQYFDTYNLNLKKYFVNRFSRIYPMYFILTTILFLLSINNQNIYIYILNITFIRGFFNDYKFTGIGQGWSLTVEEMFYFLAPLFFILIKRNRLMFLVLPMFFIGFGFVLVTIFSQFSLHSFMNSYSFMLDFTFFGRCIEFFTGIALALFVKKYSASLKTKYITHIGILYIFLCVLSLSNLKYQDHFGTDTSLGKVINTFFLPILGIAPLFWGLINEKTRISKILGSTIFSVLGKSSYVFYLIHMGFLANFLSVYLSHNYIVLFVSLNIVAVILYLYVEEPINIFLRKKF